MDDRPTEYAGRARHCPEPLDYPVDNGRHVFGITADAYSVLPEFSDRQPRSRESAEVVADGSYGRGFHDAEAGS